MRWPLDTFVVSQGFLPGHTAVDLAANMGTPVRAPESGRVVALLGNWKPGGYFGGNYVKIRGNSGHVYYMGHMSKVTTQLNETVTEGQVVGHVGNTGISTGPHVHFEMSKDGVMLDARNWIKQTPKGGSQMIEDTDANYKIWNSLRRYVLGSGMTRTDFRNSYVGKSYRSQLDLLTKHSDAGKYIEKLQANGAQVSESVEAEQKIDAIKKILEVK